MDATHRQAPYNAKRECAAARDTRFCVLKQNRFRSALPHTEETDELSLQREGSARSGAGACASAAG